MRSIIQNVDAYDVVLRNGVRYGTQVLSITANFTIAADPPPVMLFNPGSTSGLSVILPPLTTTAGIDGRTLVIGESAAATVNLNIKQDPTDNSGAVLTTLTPGLYVTLIVVNAAWQIVGYSSSAAAGDLILPRNAVDGGDFTTNPFQRGTTKTGVSNTVTYLADRFFAIGGASSSISMSQQAQTDVAGFGNSLRWGRGAGTDTAVIKLGQVFESNDSIRFQGQTATLSFWAKAGAQFSAANSAINVLIATGTSTNDTAANLASGSWAGYVSQTVTPNQGTTTPAANIAQVITATATRYSFTVSIPSNATQIGFVISYAPTGTNNTTDTVDFYGFQFEVGGAATVFEHMDIQMVLEICQRYFWQVNEPAAGVVVGQGSMNTTTAAIIYMATPVQMRTAPTVTVTAGTFGVRPANATLSGTIAAGSTHTANALTINVGTVTSSTAGFGTPLFGGGGSGVIAASADF